MPTDWIKMRSDIYRDPRVCMIADLLMDKDSDLSRFVNQNCQRDMSVTRNVTRNAVVGALVSVWGVARHNGDRDGDDLVIDNATLAVLDDVADLPGFGEAMAVSGWVVDDGKRLVFPSFFTTHNVDPHEKTKALAAERQRRKRARDASRDSHVTVTHREEKRREEKSIVKKKVPKKRQTAFKPPTVAEVAAYCAERKNTVDAQTFVDHYTANGWMRGKTKLKDWQAAVRTWERSQQNGNGKPSSNGHAVEAWHTLLATIQRISPTHEPDRLRSTLDPAILAAAERIGLRSIECSNDFDKSQMQKRFAELYNGNGQS